MRRSPCHLLIASLVIACAAASPPPATPGEGEPSAGPESDPDAARASSKAAMEAGREPFLQSCMAEARSAGYCECGFQQFSEIFADVDLSRELEPTDPRVQLLRERTLTACANKMDEAQVKANFLEGCVEGNQKKSAYCSCAWQELRESLEVAELLGDGTQPRFVAAKTKMVAACKGKLTHEIPRADFMPACIQEQPEREKPCACIWKKLTAKFSAEELAAGTVDVTSVPGLDACSK